MGIMPNGHCLRLASCQSGHKTSNGPLAVLTDAVLKYFSRSRNLDGSCCVDDFIVVHHDEYHGECVCVDGGAPNARSILPRPGSSKRSRTRCSREDDDLQRLGAETDLHMRRNEKGHSNAQHGE